jgi:hemolysin-activating ACP:hemolysin acyltransferase
MLFRSNKSGSEPNPVAKPGSNSPANVQGRSAEPSAEHIAEVKRRAAKSKQLQASFGEIVGLLMRSPQFKDMPLSSLEVLVLPAIANGQFMIAEAQAKKSGFIAPVAAVLWASVSEEVDRRLSASGDAPVKLGPKDWKSGDIPWLIIAAGDQRLIKALLQRLEKTVLKGRPLKSSFKQEDESATAAAN